MSRCSILPQIRFEGGVVDSLAFSQIWESAKIVYGNTEAARNVAKKDYYQMFSDAFKAKYGDWSLLHKINNDYANDKDLAVFATVYKSNLESLKQSVITPLNMYGEPDIKNLSSVANYSEIFDDYSNSQFIDEDDQIMMNKVFSNIIISTFNLKDRANLANLNINDFHNGTILDNVVNELKEMSKGFYDPEDVSTIFGKSFKSNSDEIDKIIDYIENDKFKVWDLFVGYFANKYKIKIEEPVKDITEQVILNALDAHKEPVENIEEVVIVDSEKEEDVDQTSDDNNVELAAEITKLYSDAKQLTIDHTKTISSEIHFELAKSVHGDIKLVTKYKSEDSNSKQLIPSAENKFGINIPFDVDDIWNQILSVNYSASTKEQIIDSLNYISNVHFKGSLSSFIDRLISDNQFYAIFYRAAKLSVMDIAVVNIEKIPEVEFSSAFSIDLINRSSKADRVAFDQIQGLITNRLSANLYKPEDILNGIKRYNDSITLIDKAKELLNLSNLIGLKLTEHSIAQFIKLDTKLPISIMNLNSSLSTYKNLQDISDMKRSLDKIKDRIETIAANILLAYGIDYKQYRGKDISSIPLDGLTKPGKLKKNIIYNGALNNIADMVKYDVSNLTSMSYYNANYDREHSPQYNSFFTDFFDSLTSSTGTKLSREQILERFNDYINDPRLDFDNMLWNMDEDLGHSGIFSPGKKSSTKKQVDIIHTKEFLDKLSVINLNGARYMQSSLGDAYRDIRDDNWNLVETVSAMNGYYLIPTSDSGRMYGVKRTFEHFEGMIPDDAFDLHGNLTTDTIADADGTVQLRGLVHEFNENSEGILSLSETAKNSRLYKYFLNNLYQELKDIQLTFDKIFDKEAYLTNRTLKIKDFYKDTNNANSLLRGIEVALDGSIIKNGKPAGRLFNLSNLVYVKNGVKYTLQDVIKGNSILNFINKDGKETSVEYDFLQAVLSSDLHATRSDNKPGISTEGLAGTLQIYVERFFADWLVHNQKETADGLRYIKQDIIKAKNRRKNEDNVVEASEGEAMQSKIRRGDLMSVPKKRDGMKSADIDEWSFNIAALNLFLNNHFNTVIFGNLLFGNVTEFKNMIDWNKRVSQTIRNGSSAPSNETYSQLIMHDVMLKSNMLEMLDKMDVTEEAKEEFRERYKKPTETTNAINIITDEEFLKRMEAFGVKDRYEDLVNAINDESQPFNPKDYHYLAEQMKFFSYTRKAIDGRVVSVQSKNSTIILFKRLVKGTERELLYDFMKNNKINDINTLEGHKLPIKAPIKLYNEDGTINRQIVEGNPEDLAKVLNPHKIELSYKDLRIQLEVVPHLENTVNRIATQLIKKNLINLEDDVNYDISLSSITGIKGNKLKGKTGSYKDGEMGYFEMYQYALSYTAEESAMELLHEFGAIKDGRIQYVDNGETIVIDSQKIAASLEHYFVNNSTDMNVIKAVHRNADGLTNLPYHHPSLLRLIEQVLEAKITNKITRQKMDGSHLVLQPNMFNAPIKAVKDSTNQDTYMTYTREYLKESTARGEDGYANPRKLMTEYLDKKGVYHPAQIVMNPHRKEFYRPEFLMDDGSGRVDINKIKAIDPKLLLVFGTRIPNEGYNSTFTGEIVGFLQDRTSTAITPDHLIIRTGWDFDIDTVYLYHFAVNSNSLKVADIFDNSTSAENRRLYRYVNKTYPELITDVQRDADTALKLSYKKLRELDQTNIFGRYEKLKKQIEGKPKVSGSKQLKQIAEDFNEMSEEDKLKNAKLYAALSYIIKRYNSFGLDNTYRSMISYEKAIENHDNGSKVLSAEVLATKKAKLSHFRKKLATIQNLNMSTIADQFGKKKPEDISNEDKARLKTFSVEFRAYEKIINDHYDGTTILSNERLNEVKTLKAELRSIINSIKFDPIVLEFLNDRNAQKKAIWDEINANKTDANKYKDLVESYRDEFDKLDIIRKSTRQERNNLILSSFIAMHMHPNNFRDREKTGDMKNTKSASDFVNKLLGFNQDTAHPTSLISKLYFRNLNMNISTLKENSVAYDNILAIASVLKIYNSKHHVPATMRFEEVAGYKASDTFNTIHKHFTKIFGDGNFTVDNDNKIVYIKNIGYIATNAFGSNLDIQGQPIMEQRSEFTTNILDAVKSPMVNLNSDTFSLVAYLASTPLSYNTNLIPVKDDDGNITQDSSINRFIFPFLFIGQPIVQDLTKRITSANRFGDSKYGKYVISEVKGDYTRNLIDTLLLNPPMGLISFPDYIEDMSKNYTLPNDERFSKRDGSEYTPSYIQQLELNVKSAYFDALESIKKHSIGKPIRNISQTILNDYLKFIGFPQITSMPMTLDKLVAAIEYSKDGLNTGIGIADLEFYTNQLSMLNYYEIVDKASSDIKSLMSIFNTDKLGAGPTSSVTNKLLNNIIKAYMDYNGFEEHLRSKYKETSDVYYQISKEINSTFYGQATIINKINYLTSMYGQYDYDNREPVLKTLKGKGAVEAVYGSLFNNEIPDYTKSEYPYLAAQGIWTNLLSTKLYNTTLLSEHVAVKSILNKTLAELNSVNDDKFRYRLLMYMLNRDVSQLDFFNNTDYSKILSIPEIVWNDETKTNEYVVPEYSFDESTDNFKTLPLYNQIQILQSKEEYADTFLKFINVKSDITAVENLGYVGISVPDSDKNLNEARSLFRKLYNSKNENARIVAENLIRYAFITNGLQFSSSVSKFLPNDIYWDTNMTLNRTNDLYKIRPTLMYLDGIAKPFTLEDIEFIHKSNWNNSNVNPEMEGTATYNRGNKEMNTNFPTWNHTLKNTSINATIDSEHPLIDHIIVEETKKIKESKYANLKYLIKSFELNDDSFKVLYKRLEYNIGRYTIYYPISRSLPFEYGTSIVPEYGMIPINGQLVKIAKEEDYINIAVGISSESEQEVKNLQIEKTNDGYSKTVNRFSKDADFVIHVTNNKEDFKHKVSVNTIPNSKLKVVTEEEFGAGINLSNIESKFTVAKAKRIAKAKPSIPQNLVSGVKSGKHLQKANSEIIKAIGLGDNISSMDMISAGFRTRTTRSRAEFKKYKVNVGDFVYQEGKSKGAMSKVLTQVTAIYFKGDPRFEGNWNLEGWSAEGVNNLADTLEVAIEFKVIKNNEDIIQPSKELFNSTPLSLLILSNDNLNQSDESLNTAISNLYNRNNVSQITTILSKDNNLAKVIKNTSSINEESKTIIGLDDGSFDANFSESFYIDYVEDTAETTAVHMMSMIKHSESNIAATMERIYRMVKDKNISSIGKLKKLVDKSKSMVKNIDILDPTFSAMAEVVNQNAAMYSFVKDRIDELLDDIMITDISKFVEDYHYDEMIEYSKKLKKLSDYIIAAEHILSVPEFYEEDIDKLEGDNKNILSSYNKAVKTLTSNSEDLNRIKAIFKKANVRYHAIQIVGRSSNAEYVESIHRYAIESLKKQGFTDKEIPKFKLTETDINLVIDRMLNNNEDIAMFAAQLDSARDTYVTLSDIVGKFYGETMYRSLAEANRRARKFKELLKTVYDNTNSTFDEKREKWFMDKFVDKNGDLITEYDESSKNESLAKMRTLYDELVIKVNNLHKSKDIGYDDALSELKKLLNRINEISEKVEIKPSDPEYDVHSRVYNNSSEISSRIYAKNNNIEFKTNKGFKIYKYILKDEFRNKQYLALSDTERRFIDELRLMFKEMIGSTFDNSEVSYSFLPHAYKPTLSGEIKRFIGLSKISPETFYIDLNEEKQYYMDATMLHSPKVPNVVAYSSRSENETLENYHKRVVEEVNENLDIDEHFKSFNDIMEFNKKVIEVAKLSAKEKRNYDIGNLMALFNEEIKDVKAVKDFESYYRSALIVLGSDDFKASVKTVYGRNVIDKIKSAITGKLEVSTGSGKTLRTYGSMVGLGDTIFKVSKTKSAYDQAISVVLRYTSMRTMQFNMRAHFQNVTVGYTTMMVDALSNEFVSAKQLASAGANYAKDVVHMMADAGKLEATSFTSGMIKYFGGLFEEQTENLTSTPIQFGRVLHLWDTAGYLGMSIGEHFMQFNMLLAMLKSHRVYTGVQGLALPLSLSDFIDDRRLEALQNVLSDSMYNQLFQYINSEKAKNKNATKYIDHIGNWINSNALEISQESKDNILKEIKRIETEARVQFETLPTMEEQFELVDGFIELKADSKLTPRYIAEFAERVRGVNHTLHGIYNHVDRNALQAHFWGELMMQFRKWMRPSFKRWFGAKYGKTSYSEVLRANRSGAFPDFWKFIKMPGIKGYERRDLKSNTVKTAVANMAAGYIDFLRNVSYYYHMLPKHQQANVRRAVFQIIAMINASILLTMAYAVIGGDDDKMKHWYARNAIYQLSAYQTNLFETTRLGWITFYLRTKRSIMPSENALIDLGKLIYYTLLYPIQDDDQRTYQRGMYAGETKVEVYAKKSLPLARAIQTQQHLAGQISYYQMYNPIYNLIGNNK